jgi:hypothetical protein
MNVANVHLAHDFFAALLALRNGQVEDADNDNQND